MMLAYINKLEKSGLAYGTVWGNISFFLDDNFVVEKIMLTNNMIRQTVVNLITNNED